MLSSSLIGSLMECLTHLFSRLLFVLAIPPHLCPCFHACIYHCWLLLNHCYITGLEKVSGAADAGTEIHLKVSNFFRDIPIDMLSDDNFSEVIIYVYAIPFKGDVGHNDESV